MPAKSKAQQKIMAMALAYKRGKLKNASEKIKDLAKSMSEKELAKYASTDTSGLPKKKTNESVNEGKTQMNTRLIKRLISETVKEVLNEAAPDQQQQQQAPKFTSDQQREFFESIKKFNEHSSSIYRRTNIADSYKKIKAIVEFASQHLVEESGEWFDNVTSGRHSRRLKESFKVFEKTVSEVMKLQQRLESSYEDIGETLNKYYEIQESAMRQDITENKSVAKKKVNESQSNGKYKTGDSVQVSHKGKKVTGKIIRYDDGGSSGAKQHGGGWVVDVGDAASITVPEKDIVNEAVNKQGIRDYWVNEFKSFMENSAERNAAYGKAGVSGEIVGTVRMPQSHASSPSKAKKYYSKLESWVTGIAEEFGAQRGYKNVTVELDTTQPGQAMFKFTFSKQPLRRLTDIIKEGVFDQLSRITIIISPIVDMDAYDNWREVMITHKVSPTAKAMHQILEKYKFERQDVAFHRGGALHWDYRSTTGLSDGVAKTIVQELAHKYESSSQHETVPIEIKAFKLVSRAGIPSEFWKKELIVKKRCG